MKIDFSKLQIGDRLVRKKLGVLARHHAIYAGFWNNVHLVAENQNKYGVRYITLKQFLNEGKLDRVEYNLFDENSQIQIINRINNKIGTPYVLFKYNCEHFTNEILTGISSSKQITKGVVLGIGVMLCINAFNNNK